MNINLNRILEDDSIKALASLASEIWHEFFPCILSLEQIDYMVERFQSYPAIKNQLLAGYEYYFIVAEGQICGYMGIHEEANDKNMFLSKLYLKKECRGKGIAGEALKKLFLMSKDRGMNKVWLTVNKNNTHTIEVYEHVGFAKARTQVADIGNGFVMDDYIMEKEL